MSPLPSPVSRRALDITLAVALRQMNADQIDEVADGLAGIMRHLDTLSGKVVPLFGPRRLVPSGTRSEAEHLIGELKSIIQALPTD